MLATLIILVLTIFTSEVALTQSAFLTTLEPMWGAKIYVYDGDSIRSVYEEDGIVFFNYDIIASPDGELLSALSSSRSFITQGTKPPYVDHELLIFTANGVLIKRVARVQRHAWSPDSRKIACLVGTDYEGFSFAPESLIVINTSDWSQLTLDYTIGHQDVYWAEFDSMIYTTDFGTVYQVNPRNGDIIKTPYKGIYFSSDGNYYFEANYEGGTFRVYERQSNKDVTPEGYEENPAVNFHRWLPEGSTLVFGDIFTEKQIFDAPKSQIVGKISGQLLDYDVQTKEFIVLKHQRYFPEISDKKIERVKLSDLEKE